MFARFPSSLATLSDLRHEMERVLDSFGAGRVPWAPAAAYPALSIWDTGDALCVEAEVPGLRQDDLEIYAVGNELTLKGRRELPHVEKRVYHRQERAIGEFSRVITLPVEVDAERVDATLKDGVLTVRLPKAESAKPRKIALKVK